MITTGPRPAQISDDFEEREEDCRVQCRDKWLDARRNLKRVHKWSEPSITGNSFILSHVHGKDNVFGAIISAYEYQ